MAEKFEIKRDFNFLNPIRKTIQVTGRLFYSESNQAFSFIRLQKPILQEFPQLKEKRESYGYTIILPSSYSNLKSIISTMERDKNIVPMIMFFFKRKMEKN